MPTPQTFNFSQIDLTYSFSSCKSLLQLVGSSSLSQFLSSSWFLFVFAEGCFLGLSRLGSEGIEYWDLRSGEFRLLCSSYFFFFSCRQRWIEPKPSRKGAHRPQNMINFRPALSPNMELNQPYIKGAGRYPSTFLIISPLEFPKALKYGGTETIIIPVNPGIMAPPKNSTIHNSIAAIQNPLTKGSITAHPIPTAANTNTTQTVVGLSQPPRRLMMKPPQPHPEVGPVMETIAQAMFTCSRGNFNTFMKQSVSQNCTPVDTNRIMDIVSVPTRYIFERISLFIMEKQLYFLFLFFLCCSSRMVY